MHEEKCGEGRHEAFNRAVYGRQLRASVGQPTAMRSDCFRSWSTLLSSEKMFEAQAKVKGRGHICIHRMSIPNSFPGSPDVP